MSDDFDDSLDDESGDELPSRAEFLAGRCYDMAVALHEATGLPLFGLYGDGGCHHAFVWDAERQVGLDARGALPLDALRKGCRGQDMQPLALDEIAANVGRPLADEEIGLAHDFIEQDDVLVSEVERYRDRPAAVPAAGPR